MCCICNKVIDIERMGESALNSHMKGEKHKRNSCTTSSLTQSALMGTFLRKEASSSCDVRPESGSSHAEGNNDEFSVPPPPSAADGPSAAKFTVHRVDEFFTTLLIGDNYAALLDVVKILLVFSHGQASVERGFSVNKEVKVENLHEHSLVAQRVIGDHLRAVGGVLNVPITKKLLAAAASSRQKYEKRLQDQSDKKKTDEERRKRKQVMDEIEELKERKKRMRLDVDSLVKSADDMSEKAEETG